jgi:alpha/beta superfamily hydrolase
VNPFFFGTKERRLFGAYDPPRGAGRRGAVICYPWAREYLLAHATIRHLSRLLSGTGFHVLRFDYFGTGDSAGDVADGGQDQWLADVQTAVEELKDVGQLAQVGLIGMRYGAALAAWTAGRRRDIDRLVLWDPVFDGRAYLEELAVAPQAAGAGADVDAKGAVLTDRLRHEMETITLTSFGPGLPRTLILGTAGPPDAYAPLQAQLAGAGVDGALEHLPDVHVWEAEWGGSGQGVGMAVSAVNRIVAWMS